MSTGDHRRQVDEIRKAVSQVESKVGHMRICLQNKYNLYDDSTNTKICGREREIFASFRTSA